MVRYLVIVGRSQPGLCDYLRRRFEGDRQVLVLTDRRHVVRRERVEARREERRRGERRQPRPEPPRFETVAIIRRDDREAYAESSSPSTAATRLPSAVHALFHLTVNGTQETTTMEEIQTDESRKHVIRWLDESRHLFGLLPGVLDDLLSAEQERARLRQRIDECRAENERLRRERAELAEALTKLISQMTGPVNEIVEKLRLHSQETP